MDRFNAMATFACVADVGSISGAAERLGIAKSAVSRRLRDLENHLGVELIHRTTRHLALTPSGEHFYHRATRLLADLDEAEEAVSREHGELSGVIRLAAPLSFGLLHLQPAINAFMAAHPRVNFDLNLDDNEVDLVAEGFDLGVRLASLPDSTLIARKLAPIRNMAAASPDYLARRGTPHHPSQLTDHDCLIYSNVPANHVWGYRDEQGRWQPVKGRTRLRVNNGDFLREAAIRGAGIVIEPTFLLHHAVAEGRLVPVLTDTEWPEIGAYAVYPQTRHLAARVRAFIDFLGQRFAGEPYWDQFTPPGSGYQSKLD
ncbi:MULTISPECIES: LysR family transcriptional regulator [unclassified Guyparkeria]|uniref:LysR family transcriptional regulator n=1 Tax=unclassified Guyparkeria TaxID=2626246 RepID=UPI0007335A51|nr:MULTISPECIES: LysR family transcriptional regulator [unclassified Guyparkeria]KTG16340.1 LysR family transcriptional regulator [Guyparkeria sp. XI15]OAE85280.1 LysR family transcriptional regulator [Guyparkeria sp. WRN-7]